MRLVLLAALAFALAACGDGGGGGLAVGNSQLTQAQIDAALGPADQSAIEDAIPTDDGEDAAELPGNGAGAANAAAAAPDEDEEEDGVTSE